MGFSANVARLFHRENMYLRSRGISNYIFEGFLATINEIFVYLNIFMHWELKRHRDQKLIISTNNPIKKWGATHWGNIG